jgi:hypothetical protein
VLPFVIGATATASVSLAAQLSAGAESKSGVLQLAGMWTVAVLLVLFVPQLLFVGVLFRTRWKGIYDWDQLAIIYSRRFSCRWLEREPDHDLLGSADIQSMADLENSCRIVHSMRIVPFELRDVIKVLVAVAIPCLPLALVEMSLADLLMKLAQAVVGMSR